MRTQFEGQSLRIRINETDIAQLLAGTTLDNLTHWPDGSANHRRVELSEHDGWQRVDDGWCLQLARTPVQELADRLPTKEGIDVALDVPAGVPLHVVVDVDTRDSARRRLKKKHA